MAIINGGKSDIPEEGLVLVDFWAPWCGPCKLLAPNLEKLNAEYEEKLPIVKINVDKNPDVSAEYGVMGIPTMVLLKDGKEVGRKVGYQSVDFLRTFIEEHK